MPTLKYVVVGVAGVVGAIGWVGSAAADKVGPLVPQAQPAGVIEKEAIDKLHEAVVRGLDAGGMESLRAPEAREKLRGDLAECAGGPCTKRAAQVMGAGRVVTTSVQVNGKNYDIECQLWSAAGASLAKAAGSCDICTFAEAQTATTRVATELAKRAPPAGAPPVVAPVPVPPGNRPTQPAPTQPAAQQPPTETAPPAEPVAEPTASISTEEAPSRHPNLWYAVGAGGLGLVSIIVGGYLVSIHGDPSCTSQDAGFNPDTDCPEVFSTAIPGVLLMAVGAGAIVGGVWLYLRQEPLFGDSGASIVPLQGGGAAAVWTRF